MKFLIALNLWMVVNSWGGSILFRETPPGSARFGTLDIGWNEPSSSEIVIPDHNRPVHSLVFKPGPRLLVTTAHGEQVTEADFITILSIMGKKLIESTDRKTEFAIPAQIEINHSDLESIERFFTSHWINRYWYGEDRNIAGGLFLFLLSSFLCGSQYTTDLNLLIYRALVEKITMDSKAVSTAIPDSLLISIVSHKNRSLMKGRIYWTRWMGSQSDNPERDFKIASVIAGLFGGSAAIMVRLVESMTTPFFFAAISATGAYVAAAQLNNMRINRAIREELVPLSREIRGCMRQLLDQFNEVTLSRMTGPKTQRP